MSFIYNSTKATNLTSYGGRHQLNHEFCLGIALYFICLGVTGIICNSILIFTIRSNQKLHKTANYLIINLAICDLITCCNLAFDSHYLLLHEYYTSGAFLCASTKATNLALLPLSIFSLLLLTFEKLLAFLYPFQHHDILTKEKVYVLLLFTWVYSIVTGCFPILNNSSSVVTGNGACHLVLTLPYKLFQLVVDFAVPLVCILIMDVFIFRIAMQSADTTRRLSNGTQCKKVEIVKNWRRTRTIITVVANESLCWFVYMIAVSASIACGGCLPPEVPWIMNGINYTSVATNPLIYGLLNRSVRHYVWNLCCKRTKSRHLASKYSKGSVKTERTSVTSSRVSLKRSPGLLGKNGGRESVAHLLVRTVAKLNTDENFEMTLR